MDETNKKEYVLKVAEQDVGMRLDLYLLKFSQSQGLDLSRNFIQKLILDKHVALEGKSLSAHYKVRQGQIFQLQIPDRPQLKITPQDIALDIWYEDEDVIVVNKPIGMVVHPSPGNYHGTLVNALLYHCASLSTINPQRAGIVHRLDKDTSGLMVAAKNNTSHLHLARQFAQHTVLRRHRLYQPAVCRCLPGLRRAAGILAGRTPYGACGQNIEHGAAQFPLEEYAA